MSRTEDDILMSFPRTPLEMLSKMARLYKYDLSEFEAMLWTNQIFMVYPDEVVMRALLAHMESGKPDANFMPKYGAIKSALEPVRGFKEIEAAVRRWGPYQLPEINDPVLIAAIERMGGWVRVCTEMPDPASKPIDFDRYVKRFETALSAASTSITIQRAPPAPLKAIGQAAPAPALSAPVPLALAAPMQGATVEVGPNPSRASIWGKTKP